MDQKLVPDMDQKLATGMDKKFPADTKLHG